MNQMLKRLNEDDVLNENHKTKSFHSQFCDEFCERSLSDNGLLTDEQYFRIGNGENIEDVRQDNKYKMNVVIPPKTSLNEESLSDSPSTLHDTKNNDLSFSIPIYNLGDDNDDVYNNSDSKSMKTIYHEGFNELSNQSCGNGQKGRIKKSIKGIFNKKKSKDSNIYIKPQTSAVLDNQTGLPSVNITQFTGKDAYNNIRVIPPLPTLPNKMYALTHGTNNTELTMLNNNSSSNNVSPSDSNNSAKTIPFTAQSDQTMYEHNSNPHQKQRSNSNSMNETKNAIINLYDYSSRYETPKNIKIKEKSSKVLLNNELDSNIIYNTYNVW